MATATTIVWIDHDGSGIPVEGVAKVIPQFRADENREAAEKAAGGFGVAACSYEPFWSWGADSDASGDVLAYCVVAK